MDEISVYPELTAREAQALAVAGDDYAESGRTAEWDEEDVEALDSAIDKLRRAGSF